MNIINVVAGVITKENLFFIAQRNRKKHLGLKWEFPGGKVYKNEKNEDALKREIKEELSITILVKKKLQKKDTEMKKLILSYIIIFVKSLRA